MGFAGFLALLLRAPTLSVAEEPVLREACQSPLPLVVISTRVGLRYERLPPIRFTNTASGVSIDVRLYDESGGLSDDALSQLTEALADVRKPGDHVAFPLAPRLLQVIARAAYHFECREVLVVSGYRKPGRYTEGHHAHGRAMDFSLVSVPRKELAAFMRSQPRLGVGEYIHPRTQYVHVDVRDESFHWLDGTRPGRPGGYGRLSGFDVAKLDATYTPLSDLPEGAVVAE